MLVNAIDVAVPEHIVCDDGVAVATGVGLITTVVVADALHPFRSVTVTVYVPAAANVTLDIEGF